VAVEDVPAAINCIEVLVIWSIYKSVAFGRKGFDITGSGMERNEAEKALQTAVLTETHGGLLQAAQ